MFYFHCASLCVSELSSMFGSCDKPVLHVHNSPLVCSSFLRALFLRRALLWFRSIIVHQWYLFSHLPVDLWTQWTLLILDCRKLTSLTETERLNCQSQIVIIIIIVWLVQWWTLSFLRACFRLDDSTLNDRRLSDQCWVVQDQIRRSGARCDVITLISGSIPLVKGPHSY